MAIFYPPLNLSVQDRCTIEAAGAAGEVLEYGEYGQVSTWEDRKNVSRRDVEADFELLVERAKQILIDRRTNFDRLTSLLRERLFDPDNEVLIETLPTGENGAFILDEDDLA
jgi:hypothetical protein